MISPTAIAPCAKTKSYECGDCGDIAGYGCEAGVCGAVLCVNRLCTVYGVGPCGPDEVDPALMLP